jgi:hypothetical protein
MRPNAPTDQSEVALNTTQYDTEQILLDSRHTTFHITYATYQNFDMASSAVHFLFDAVASLVALDESDGLLNFRAAFRSFEPQTEVRNAPIVLTLVVCARILQVLVSMLSFNVAKQTLS